MSHKKLLPLFIAAQRGSWRMIDWHAHEGDGRYATIRKSVLERDDYTCGYCGFRSLKYQQVHHKNHDHGSNKLENLVTACALCHQCFHLGLAGVHNSGVIIYLPEISQANLNNLARACFVARHNVGKHEEAARTLCDALESRTYFTEEMFGVGTSSPSAFGQAFVEMPPEAYAARKVKMPGLRLMPRMAPFAAEIAYWQTDINGFAKFPDAEWDRLVPLLVSEPDEEQAFDLGEHAESGEDGSDGSDRDTVVF